VELQGLNGLSLPLTSLSYLNELKFDTVKVDRSFVSALQDGSDKNEIVRTILELAKKIGADVVAEGAETPEQYAELKRLGCQYVQGYFVSRPLEERAAAAWLANHRQQRARLWESEQEQSEIVR